MIALLVRSAPCAACGTEGGFVYEGNHRPARMSGLRFGIDGPLCVKCYYRLRYQKVVRPRKLAGRETGRDT